MIIPRMAKEKDVNFASFANADLAEPTPGTQ